MARLVELVQRVGRERERRRWWAETVEVLVERASRHDEPVR